MRERSLSATYNHFLILVRRVLWVLAGTLWLWDPGAAFGAEDIPFRMSDGETIVGEFYEGGSSAPFVLMLQQCDPRLPQSYYGSTASYLSGQGIDVLTLDYRGYGKSVNDEIDFVLSSELDLDEANAELERRYGGEENLVRIYESTVEKWHSDVQEVLQIARQSGIADGEFYLLGASCSASIVLKAMEMRDAPDVSGAVLVSGRLIERYLGVAADEQLQHEAVAPLLLLAAIADEGALGDARRVMDSSTNLDDRMYVVGGDLHGMHLLNGRAELSAIILQFIRRVSAKDEEESRVQ